MSISYLCFLTLCDLDPMFGLLFHDFVMLVKSLCCIFYYVLIVVNSLCCTTLLFYYVLMVAICFMWLQLLNYFVTLSCFKIPHMGQIKNQEK